MFRKASILFLFFLILSVFWHFYQNDIFNKTISFFSDYFDNKNKAELVSANNLSIEKGMENLEPKEEILVLGLENATSSENDNTLKEPIQNNKEEVEEKKEAEGSKTESFVWISTTYRNGKTVRPKKEGSFSLLFDEKTFTTDTDCNIVGGEYSFFQNRIVFNNIHSTKKACQDSDEGEFKKILENAGTFYFTDLGELVIVFKGEEASALFK